MATKAELEKQLAELQAQAAVRKPAFEEAIDINTAIDILGISLVSLGGTRDKKIQAIQQDIRILTIAVATLAAKVEASGAVRNQKEAALKEAQA